MLNNNEIENLNKIFNLTLVKTNICQNIEISKEINYLLV